MASVALDTNPYSLFDPTQWSNAYSNYNNAALPWGNSYAGVPYNSLGQPIQPTPGMTLNQSPAQPQQPAAAAQAGGVNPNQALINAIYQGGGQSGGGFGGQGSGTSFGSGAMLESLLNQGGYGASAASTPATSSAPAALQPTSGGLTNAQYMALRANPGRVTTPGATVPQNTSGYGASPGGTSAFLQNWKPATSGPSSQFQQGFYSALKNLGY